MNEHETILMLQSYGCNKPDAERIYNELIKPLEDKIRELETSLFEECMGEDL